ncbi:MAG: hypothetical protein ACYCOR_11400 [Acidobacteriaceae bacterium]
MSTSIASTEYRNLPLAVLTESKTSPRRIHPQSGRTLALAGAAFE